MRQIIDIFLPVFSFSIRIFLSATTLSDFVSRARYTTPYVPSPMRFSFSNSDTQRQDPNWKKQNMLTVDAQCNLAINLLIDWLIDWTRKDDKIRAKYGH